MNCPKCDCEMDKIDIPIEKILIIPFTRIEIVIRTWGKEDYCFNCEMERNKRNEEQIADSIGEQAYKEGFRDGRNQ